MKKWLCLILIVCCTGFMLFGCNDNNNGNGTPSTETETQVGDNLIRMIPKSVSLGIGETCKLSVYTLKEVNAIEWSSSNEDVAAVDAMGNVVGISGGSAVITASIGEYEKAFCSINVTQTLLADYSFSFGVDSLTLYLGDGYRLNAIVRFGSEILNDTDIVWKSDDYSVATVNNGFVQAVGNGTTVISAEYQSKDGNKFSAECVVFVTEFYRVKLNNVPEIIEVGIGEQFTVSFSVYDRSDNLLQDTDENVLSLYSENDLIVTYENGYFRALNSGVTNIIVEYGGGYAICPVSVAGVSAEMFDSLFGAQGNGVVLNKDGLLCYNSLSVGLDETYACIKGETWASLIQQAKDGGFTKIKMIVYSIDGVFEPRPANTEFSLFDVEDDCFWVDENVTDLPITASKSVEECESWPYMLIGMYGDGSFVFTISFE